MKKFKRVVRLALFLFTIFACVWIFSTAPQHALPDKDLPLIFYSNHTRHNLHKLFLRAIRETRSSLSLTIYALTDPEIRTLLAQKSVAGIKTKILYDPSATPPLEIATSKPVEMSRGLMHRKILILDHEKVLLGSANLTATSLKAHDNLVAALYHPGLANFLGENESGSHLFSLGKTKGELWLLPSERAQARLIEEIDHAKEKIYVAMFTLTHPLLTEALISAHKRGVDVRVALDHYTAEGASAPVLKQLRESGIPLFLSQGQQLFHHKWAWIDRSTFILGSANWTRAAFTQNQDCLMILHHLKFKHKKQLEKIWNIIEKESIN
ncbi:MAG: phosphatidylserine/phosphatidylglycerophosphate/cardiolipin synthase family protein [Chlamydiales bacterium]